MKIFQAETGTEVEVFLPPNASINSLKQLLSQSTGILPENQILLEREGGVVESIQGDIYMFDKSSFARDVRDVGEKWIDFEVEENDAENIEYPKEILDADKTGHALAQHAKQFYFRLKQAENFARASLSCYKYCSRKIQEQKVMIEAIKVAVANLNGHANFCLGQINNFETKFRNYDKKFSSLLATIEDDLEKLKIVELHPLLRSPNNDNRTTLYDTIPHAQIKNWIPKCGIELKLFRERFESSLSSIDWIKKSMQKETMTIPIVNFNELSHFLKEASNISQKENAILESFKQDYSRLLELLRQPYATNALSIPALHHTSLAHIQKRIFESKNNLTKEMFTKLRNISETQSQIGKMSKKVSTWVSVLRNLVGKFGHLEIVSYLPDAYEVGLLEIMRRRKFERKMNLMARAASDKMESIRDEEIEMRKRFTKKFGRYLPPNTIPILSQSVPSITLSLPTESLPPIDTPIDLISPVNVNNLRSTFGDDISIYNDLLDENSLFHQMEETVSSSSIISVSAPSDDENISRLYAACLRSVISRMDMDENTRQLMSQLTAAAGGKHDQVNVKLLKKIFGL